MSPIVKLVSITPKAEELIAYCARVSNPSNQLNTESERDGFLRYHKSYCVSACSFSAAAFLPVLPKKG